MLLLFVVFKSRKKADLVLVLNGYKGNLVCIDNASIWDDIPFHAADLVLGCQSSSSLEAFTPSHIAYHAAHMGRASLMSEIRDTEPLIGPEIPTQNVLPPPN